MGKLFAIMCCALAAGAGAPAAADIPVYDDTLHAGFEDWSWGGGVDLANPAPVHAGSHSIRFSGANWNALSIRSENTYATALTGLRFWIHGGATGGQQLALVLEGDGGASSAIALDALGVVPAAGQWKEAQIDFDAITALDGFAAWNRFSIQSNRAAAQAALYIDDIRIMQAGGGADALFANGFEGGDPPAANGLLQEQAVQVAGMSSDRFTWRDSADQPRVAVLAHNNAGAGPGGARGGALREFRYQASDGSARTARVTSYGNGGHAGFGYVVSHSAWVDGGVCNGDDSPLGGFIPGQFQRVFTGRHHAIFRFTQNYPRNCRQSGAAQTVALPVTIDWVFSTGRDHPLWAISYDMSALPAGYLADDSRAPYGELVFDGDGSQAVSGVAWGDLWKFTTTSAPVALDSAWSWNQPNTVPHVKEWIASTDATMGIVQTQPLQQQDAGGGRNPWYHDLTARWNTTSANGPAGDGYMMPWQDSWPYQAIAWSFDPATPNAPTHNTRLTWGTPYGFLGQASYESNTNTAPGDHGPLRSGYPRQSYSTWIVLGAHSADPVGLQVAESEVLQSLTLTATVGAVASEGPAGIARPDTRSYVPAGYDPVYGALTFQAVGNRLSANIKVGAGSLRHPLLIVRNYTGALPASVKLGGATLVRDVDYFPSLRADAAELWITLNRTLSGASNALEIQP